METTRTKLPTKSNWFGQSYSPRGSAADLPDSSLESCPMANCLFLFSLNCEIIIKVNTIFEITTINLRLGDFALNLSSIWVLFVANFIWISCKILPIWLRKNIIANNNNIEGVQFLHNNCVNLHSANFFRRCGQMWGSFIFNCKLLGKQFDFLPAIQSSFVWAWLRWQFLLILYIFDIIDIIDLATEFEFYPHLLLL